VLTALELASTFPGMIVENFYKKTLNSIEAGRAKPPHAFVIPGRQQDATQVARVVNLLRRQGIEVHRTNSEIKVKDGAYPAGSYVVKLGQPYGRLAKTLLEKQTYPDANLRTYDDSAWTMGLASNIEVKAIDDKAILDVPADLVAADVQPAGIVSGSAGTVYAVKHNGALNLITLRYRLKDLPIKGAKAPFKAGGEEYPAGSLLIPAGGETGARVRREIQQLGLIATAMPSMPDVQAVDADLPRLAVYTTWSNTEKVGWVRLAFDRWEVAYDLIHKDHVKKGRLREQYDVIVVPHQGQNGKSIVHEQPKLTRPLPYRKNEQFKSLGLYAETDDVRGGMGLDGVAELARFVEEGGLLMTLGVASYLPAEFGITRGVDSQRPQGNWYAPGPYVQTEILQAAHPVLYGYAGKNIPVRWADGPLLQVEGSNPDLAPFLGSTPNRSSILLRFTGGDSGVLSGLLRGADQLRNRPALVDAPVGKGRVLMYVMNPIYRWQTFGEHQLVFNALLYHNDLPPPEPPKPTTTAQQAE
jgi:hypothetical protein